MNKEHEVLHNKNYVQHKHMKNLLLLVQLVGRSLISVLGKESGNHQMGRASLALLQWFH